MTHFGDDLYLGSAQTLDTTNNLGGVGVGPMGRTYTFDVVPLQLQANNIATAQKTTGAANLTLTAGTGVTAETYRDTAALRFDTPRNVRFISTAPAVTAFNGTVYGWDSLGETMTETVTHPGGAATVLGKKAFYRIRRVAISASTATNITVGTGDAFGLPYRLADINHVVSVKWASALAQDAGTAVAADVTSPATATTGDVRGTYTPSSASDGSRRLTLTMFLPALASGPNATRAGALGVTQV